MLAFARVLLPRAQSLRLVTWQWKPERVGGLLVDRLRAPPVVRPGR